MKTIAETLRPLAVGLFVLAIPIFAPAGIAAKSPVNYVNPYIGNVSHLLVPTFPTVHLPNSMLLVYPQRSAFNISPTSGAPASPVAKYNYDNEHIAPYCYSVELGDNSIRADYAPSHQSAVYALHFNDGNPYIAISTPRGRLSAEGNHVSGYQQLSGNTRIYLYLETEQEPQAVSTLENGRDGDCLVMQFVPSIRREAALRHIAHQRGASRKEPAPRNRRLRPDKVAQAGRRAWNEALGSIMVDDDADDMTTFYTSLYRTFERPICSARTIAISAPSTAWYTATTASRSIPTTGYGTPTAPLIRFVSSSTAIAKKPYCTPSSRWPIRWATAGCLPSPNLPP